MAAVIKFTSKQSNNTLNDANAISISPIYVIDIYIDIQTQIAIIK